MISAYVVAFATGINSGVVMAIFVASCLPMTALAFYCYFG
jgi:hypothetical protein